MRHSEQLGWSLRGHYAVTTRSLRGHNAVTTRTRSQRDHDAVRSQHGYDAIKSHNIPWSHHDHEVITTRHSVVTPAVTTCLSSVSNLI